MMTVPSGSTGVLTEGGESLADYAYRTLRDRLVLLDILPGTPIVESRLASEIGVGRTPFREALKRLESDHLVVTFARRGTFATHVDITELPEISEMRRVLVPLAAQKAAAHRGRSVREELSDATAVIEGFTEQTSRRTLLEYDLRVHRLLGAAAENPYLEETLGRLDNLVTRMWAVMLQRIPHMAPHVQEHLELLRVILNGETDRAETLAAEHVGHFDRIVRKLL